MRTYGLTIVLFAILVACSGEVTTNVDLVIDAGECTRALSGTLIVRVYSDEGELVETFERTLLDEPFPTGIRLAPRGGDASRSWYVEAEVLDATGVSLSFQRARGDYSEGVSRELELPFDDACLGIACRDDETCRRGECVSDLEPAAGVDTPLAACPVFAWVDGATGTDGADCTDASAPCASPEHAFETHVETGRGLVINVHGAAAYTSAPGREVVGVRDVFLGGARHRRVFRPWPGTGRPTIDATGNEKGFLINGSFVVIDGFEIHGALEHGISINGAEANDVVVRNCEIWGNGAGPASFANEAAVNANNDAARPVIVDNVLRDNASTSGGSASGIKFNGNHDAVILGNTVTGNQGTGMDLGNSDRTVVRGNTIIDNAVGIATRGDGMILEDNGICGSRGIGLWLSDGASSLTHNTVVGSGEHAVRLAADASWTLERNIFAFNGGAALEGEGVASDRENLYFMNAGGETDGPTRSDPSSDIVGEDPLLMDVSACDLRLEDGSPALAAAGDGSDLGVRQSR